jgi:hypothetical protein
LLRILLMLTSYGLLNHYKRLLVLGSTQATLQRLPLPLPPLSSMKTPKCPQLIQTHLLHLLILCLCPQMINSLTNSLLKEWLIFLIKAHLAREIARNIGFPEWWNESYDLTTHLMQYVGDYLCRRHHPTAQAQAQAHDQNVWIIKPSIGTRSQGHVISDSLIHTIRLLEVNRNRVAQKYTVCGASIALEKWS